MTRPPLLLLFTFLVLLLPVPATHAQLIPTDPHHGSPIAAPALRPGGFLDPFIVRNATDDSFYQAGSDQRFGNTDVFGARLGPAGELIEKEPVAMAPTFVEDKAPAVVDDGEGYVVFYNSSLLGIMRVSVDRSGRVVGGGILADGYTFVADAAWDGSNYILLVLRYDDTIRRRRLLVERYDRSFRRSAAVELTTGDLGYALRPARLAVTGGVAGIVWYEQTVAQNQPAAAQLVVRVATVPTSTMDARISDVDAFEGIGLRPDPAITATDQSFLIAWARRQELRLAVVERSATVRAHVVIDDGDDGSELRPLAPAIAWNGSYALLSWNSVVPGQAPTEFLDRYRLRLATVTSDATVLGRATLEQTAGLPLPAAIAGNRERFVVLWNQTKQIVSGSPTPLVEQFGLPQTFRYESQSNARVVAGARVALAAWFEGGQILVGRLAADGTPLDGSGIVVGAIDFTSPRPSIAAANDQFLVVWRNAQQEVRAVRVTESGLVRDRPSLLIAASAMAPQESRVPPIVASDGSDFLILFTSKDRSLGPSFPADKLWTVVVTEARNVGVPERLADGLWDQQAGKVLWNGREYVLFWTQFLNSSCPRRFCGPRTFEVRSSLINSAGRLTASAVLPAGAPLPTDAVRTANDFLVLMLDGELIETDISGRPTGRKVHVRIAATGSEMQLLVRATGVLVLGNYRHNFPTQDPGFVGAIEINPQTLLPFVSGTVLEDASFFDAWVLGGATRLAYSSNWRAMPQAHAGAVARIYSKPLLIRSRERAPRP